MDRGVCLYRQEEGLKIPAEQGWIVSARSHAPALRHARLTKTPKGAERADTASEEDSKAEHGEGRRRYIKGCKLYVPVQRRGNLSATS